ncbi:MAG: amidohydrolase family protein [Bryobacteraceae bacterium]|nr:amidohydrolase family protein [Bryobacteraceae bacterium]
MIAAAWLLALAVDESFVVRNVTAHPVTGPEIANASVLVKDGRIAEIGPKIAPAALKGAKVVEGKGLHLWPGMINSATELGLQEISSIRETVDTGEIGTFNPQLRALIAVNPESEFIPVTRANGITMAITMPAVPGGGTRSAGAGALIPGQMSMIHLDGWTWEEMEVKRSAAMMLVFPTVETRTFNFMEFSPGRTAFSEAKRFYDRRIKELGDYFDRARAYQQAKKAARPDFNIDLALEAMIPVLEGRTPVVIFARDERTIGAALDFIEKQKIKGVLADVQRPGKTLERIKKLNVPLVLGDATRLPEEEDDAYDKNYSLAAEVYKAGIKFCLGTMDNQFARNLPFEAGIAAGYGLPKEAAVKALTIDAAEIWGLAGDYGSIGKGKYADLILTDGDILEHKTKVLSMWIKGRPVSLDNKHTRLYQKYTARP